MRRIHIAVVALAVAATATAHETWLLPERFATGAGEPLSVDLTSGMDFPAPEVAVKPDRIAKSGVRLGGKSTDLSAPALRSQVLRFSLKPASGGAAVMFVETNPRSIELTEKQVAGYLDEIGADKSIREVWAKMPAPRQWKETYTKHAKTIVQVGHADQNWAEPVSLELELVPLDNPFALKAGAEFRVRVLRAGKPMANFRVGVQDEHGKRWPFAQSDRDGRVTLKLPTAGRCLLYGVDLHPPAQPGQPWLSRFTSLTVAVQPK